MLRPIGSMTLLALVLVGCGGGGAGTSGTPTYTVGGTVTGLTGTGLVLQFNAGEVAPVSASGTFAFPDQLGSGAAYTVTVKTQPSNPVQNCVVTNGSGTVGTANVTTVAVACSTVAGQYAVTGSVSGLVGSGLKVCIFVGSHGGGGCLDPTQQIDANGTYTLGTVDLTHAVYYGVSIFQQPSSPPQDCVISNSNIRDQAASGTGFTVSCADYLAHFYVTNAADNTLLAYSINATTGVATLVGAPIATGTSPYAILGSDSGGSRFVFVANEGSNDVSAFAVDPTTGALTAVPGSPFAAGTDPQAFAFDGSGSLYVTNAGSDNVSAYSIDGNTGALTPQPGSPVAGGTGPTSIIFDPDGEQLYVANHGGSNDISEFAIGAPLALLSSVPAGGNPLSLALGSSGGAARFVYSANPDATHPSISGFSDQGPNGALSPLPGSPFPLPVSHYIATDQTGAYLYVTSGASIVGYAINRTTGALTPLPGFPIATGANAYSITIDPTNRILYVANDGAASVSVFTLDASTGALTRMAGSPFPVGNHPKFIATF